MATATFSLPRGATNLHREKTVKMSADSTKGMEGVVPESLPKTPFAFLLVGPPGSGKSHLLMQLLTNKKLYGKKYEHVHWFSPSLGTLKVPLPKENLHDALDFKAIDVVLKELGKSKTERALFVFDDMVVDIEKQLRPFLKMIYNRRHLGGRGISIIITTQKLSKIPLALRAAMSSVFLWKTTNKKEIKSTWEEFINIDVKDFERLLTYVWDAPHNFLMLRLDVDESKRYHKNLDPVRIDF